MGFGSSAAKTITLSFYVKSNLTGTFGGSIKNSANNRVYIFSYSISSANTWERKTITIAGDTSGTWLTTNGTGININWGLALGSDWVGSAGSWGTSDKHGVTGQLNLLSSTDNEWLITGVQLEVGSVATDFEHRSFAQELALCQRYFEQYNFTNFSYEAIMATHNTNTSGGTLGVFSWRAEKRATPTVTLSADASFRLNGGGAGDTQATSMSISRTGKYTTKIDCNASRSQTTGHAGYMSRQNTETCFVQISAEL